MKWRTKGKFGDVVPSSVRSECVHMENQSRRRTVIVGALIACIIGAIGVFSTYSATPPSAYDQRAAVTATSSYTTLYAPSTIVPAGTSLTEAKCIPIQWERAFAPADAVTSLDLIDGKFAVIELKPDRPILLSQLSTQRIIVPFALGDGFRAVKINVSREGAGEGQIVPGRSVDVVWNYQASDGYRALLIAQNLRVLAVGDNTATCQSPLAGAANTVWAGVPMKGLLLMWR